MGDLGEMMQEAGDAAGKGLGVKGGMLIDECAEAASKLLASVKLGGVGCMLAV